MKSSSTKIFVNLNDFSSGCNCLSLTFIDPTDYLSKNDFLTQRGFPLYSNFANERTSKTSIYLQMVMSL